MRIVSLAPAITATVVALGERGAIVGRTPWCREVDPAVPVVWDGTGVDVERLMALRPTHCLHQITHAGHPGPEIAPAAERAGARLLGWRLERLDDVRIMILGIGTAVGGQTHERAAALAAALDATCAPDPSVESLGPVVLMFSIDPPMAFGPGSYVDDVWRALGGENAIVQGAYPELTVEELVRIDPGWIVVVGGEQSLAAVRRLPLGAVRQDRVIHASHPGLLEPGAGVIPAIEALKAAVRMRTSNSADPATRPERAP